jgi:hypothetical protein
MPPRYRHYLHAGSVHLTEAVRFVTLIRMSSRARGLASSPRFNVEFAFAP